MCEFLPPLILIKCGRLCWKKQMKVLNCRKAKWGEKKSVEDVFISLQCNRQVDEWKFPVRKV